MTVRRPTLIAAICTVLAVSCSGGDDAAPGSTAEAPPSSVGPTTTPTADADDSTPDTSAVGTATTGAAVTSTTAPATSTTTTVPDEPLLAALDLVVVRAPLGADAGPTPEFAWEPVDGAGDYRLVVLGPAGPIWAWQGTDTSVWLGGTSVEPPPGSTRLAIVEETCWSVVARADDGAIVAASSVRPVTPTGQPTHSCDPN